MSRTPHGLSVIFPGAHLLGEFTQIKVSSGYNRNHTIMPSSVDCIKCRRADANIIVNADKYICARSDECLRQHIPRDRHISPGMNVVLNFMALCDQASLDF
jgi:hypothetical protein